MKEAAWYKHRRLRTTGYNYFIYKLYKLLDKLFPPWYDYCIFTKNGGKIPMIWRAEKMSDKKSGAGSKTGMARMYVRQCLNDTPGAQLLLECSDKNEQEVMRVICSTERKRLEDLLDYDLSAKVRISKTEIEGKFYIKLLRRDSTILENFIRIAPDGTVTKEILMPEVNTAVLNDLRSKVLDGLTLEMAETRDANGIYSYFRSWRPSYVTVALMYMKKELKQPYDDIDNALDEVADNAFDVLNQERLAISLKRKEDGLDDYK